jgi:hypothetical protein
MNSERLTNSLIVSVALLLHSSSQLFIIHDIRIEGLTTENY